MYTSGAVLLQPTSKTAWLSFPSTHSGSLRIQSVSINASLTNDCVLTCRLPLCSAGKNFLHGLQWRWGSQSGHKIQNLLVHNLLQEEYKLQKLLQKEYFSLIQIMACLSVTWQRAFSRSSSLCATLTIEVGRFKYPIFILVIHSIEICMQHFCEIYSQSL